MKKSISAERKKNISTKSLELDEIKKKSYKTFKRKSNRLAHLSASTLFKNILKRNWKIPYAIIGTIWQNKLT